MEPVTDETPHRSGGAQGELGAEDRLESWKEIAAFIGRDERTAMRWARDQGMPVRRVPGAKRSRIFASRAEIRAWLAGLGTASETMIPVRASETRDAFAANADLGPTPKTYGRERLRWTAAACLVLLSVGIGILIRRSTAHRSFPASVRFAGSRIETLDEQGNRLWTHQFSRPFEGSIIDTRPFQQFVRIADLFGNGGREVLVVVPSRLGGNPDDPPYVEIDCFAQGGELLWSYVPAERFRFGEHDIGAPWHPMDILLTRRGSGQAIWVALADSLWGDSYVVNLDVRTGRPTLRYVNTGVIRTLRELQGSPTYLFVGGFNNEHDGPSIALMDENTPFAASPQTAGTRHRCTSCPPGAPDYYFVLPRSELNTVKKYYEDSVWDVDVTPQGFAAAVLEYGPSAGDVRTFYGFRIRPTVRPIEVRYGSMYDITHRDLERRHVLNHVLDMCPERLSPAPIRMWTPEQGWTNVNLPPQSAEQ